MKIKMLIVALVSSAAFCANASGFDLLDRMLCRTGCGAGTSCCGTPVQSNCCGTPAAASSCCDGNPCGGLLARPLFARRCATPCGGCGTSDCGGCSGIQTGVCNDTCCGHRRLLDMDFSLNLRCLLPKFRHCGGCDSGCGGCDSGCDSGCGCNSCGRTIVRRPMMLGCNSCNSCDSGCGCNSGCGTPALVCWTAFDFADHCVAVLAATPVVTPVARRVAGKTWLQLKWNKRLSHNLRAPSNNRSISIGSNC